AKFNKNTGKAEFFKVLKVLDKEMVLEEGQEPAKEEEKEEGEVKKVKFNAARHVMVEEAKKTHKGIKPGEEIELPLITPQSFGRIAAGTAKQVLLQRMKEAERENVLKEFSKREEQIVSGIIQRREGNDIFVDIGKATGVLVREEQIPGEFYKIGNRMRFFCLKVRDTSRGPEILLSRSHPKFLSRLFELEVPEISGGVVEVKRVSREAGSRSKIAVSSKEEGVDPVGACVGQRGTRVNAVMQELGREKIDIIPWSEKSEEFIENALSPAKVIKVKIKKDKAEVEVPQDQISLAIGRDGQNVRLASELTGWKIDVLPSKE
ncbi:MAG: transcription termination factor NusA, partial [Patescibacteria group bacterium]